MTSQQLSLVALTRQSCNQFDFLCQFALAGIYVNEAVRNTSEHELARFY